MNLLKRFQRAPLFLILIPLFIIAGALPTNAQIELSCPLGTHVMPTIGTTFDVFTGLSRQWLCYDDAGNVTGTATFTGVASAAFSALTSGTNNQATMIVGTGASLSLLNLGQLAGNQIWITQQGMLAPVLAQSTTGGSIITGHTVRVQYTLISALGETLPSPENSIVVSSCSGGTQCSVTVTAPALPTGYTGYTVYSTDNGVTGTELRQLASNACVNISANCVIQIGGAGAALPVANTAYLQPPNVQASPCHSSIVPEWFNARSDGNMYPYGGIDYISGNDGSLTSPLGRMMLCGQLFINDSGILPMAGKTSLFALRHVQGNGVTNSSTIDDRVMMFRWGNATTVTPTAEQVIGIYGETEIENNNTQCAPVGNTGSSGEDCVASIRVRADDARTAAGHTLTEMVGVHGHAATITALGASGFASCTFCIFGVIGSAAQEGVTGQPAGNANYVGVAGVAQAAAGVTGGTGISFLAWTAGTKFVNQNIGYYAQSQGSTASGGLDNWNILSLGTNGDATQGKNWLGGKTFTQALATASGTIAITGSLGGAAALTTTQLPSTVASNAFCSGASCAGAATWSYVLVGKDAAGGTSSKSTAQNVINTNSTLSATAVISICAGYNGLTGFSGWDVYRTASGGVPATLGKVGSITPGDNLNRVTVSQNCFADNGIAGDGTTAPTTNDTGTSSVAGHQVYNGATASVGTCGTSPTISGNDNIGTITVGTGVTTACTLTFASPWQSNPVCVMNDDSTAITGDISSVSTTAIIFSFSASLASGHIYYRCGGLTP